MSFFKWAGFALKSGWISTRWTVMLTGGSEQIVIFGSMPAWQSLELLKVCSPNRTKSILQDTKQITFRWPRDFMIQKANVYICLKLSLFLTADETFLVLCWRYSGLRLIHIFHWSRSRHSPKLGSKTILFHCNELQPSMDSPSPSHPRLL